MEYKKASVKDINRLIKLTKQQLIEENSLCNNAEAQLKEYFLSTLPNSSLITWLGLKNNELIATCTISFYKLKPSPINPTGHVAYIMNMFTLKEYRKQGIASHLLNTAIKEAQKLNYKVIWLKASNEAKSLYIKYGFEVLGDFMVLEL